MQASIQIKFDSLKEDFMRTHDEADFCLNAIELNPMSAQTNFTKEED
jgi:hypothetical protein